MGKKIIKLNGICTDLNNLAGINFKYIPALKGINLPLCSERKSCKVSDFNKQRNRCRNIEFSTITKVKEPSFKVRKFGCGLSEFIMPIFNNGNLRGVVLTNKVKEKNNHSYLANNSATPSLNAKQITSLVSLLNYCRMHFKDTLLPQEDGVFNTKDKIIMSRAKAFIEKNYHSKVSLRNLAREIGTSYFNLCRLFTRELNLTFTQYLALVRLNAALRLLKNLNLTVAQISYAVGFSDAQYFDRIFKKILNCTPKEYRFGPASKSEKIRQKVSSQLL